MSNEVATTEKSKVKNFLKSELVQEQIKATLGSKASNFTASVLALVGQDELLRQAEPATILSSALTAAALDLPINKNLGFAHIIGYNNTSKRIVEAQFQMGWKGFVQLAQRSGHYKTINTSDIRQGEIAKRDRLSGELTFAWVEDDKEREKLEVIGYVAYFRLTTGFEKTLYMSKPEVEAHAKRYSQSYKKGFGPWKDNFEAMALKTVVKLLISKWGPMSTELEKAMIYDQAIIKGDTADYSDGVDLETVGADDDQKRAIIEVNTETADDESDQESDVGSDSENEQGKTEEAAAVDEKPKAKKDFTFSAQKKKTGKDKTKENLKQAGLLDDKSSRS
jgi:recombination protein RecT